MRFDRVAVTGGSGRLGAFVVDELSAHCAVTVLDLEPPSGEARFENVDVLDRAGLFQALEGHDAVVHLAGIDLDQTVPGDAYLKANVLGTWNVLEAAQERGLKRAVLCSSVTATGLGEARPDFPPHYLPVDEDHPMAPCHPYGVSKQLMELAAESFVGSGGMEVISLRPMLVMLPQNFALARERAADTASRWLFYYIDPHDCARAFRCALETDVLPFSTYFITASDTCHPESTLEWMQEALRALPEVRKPEVYADNPRASVFDGSRAREVLGFSPTSDWLKLEAGASRGERA